MKLKYLILSVFALLTATVINIISYFAAFAVTVLMGSVDVTDTSTATVNQGVFNLLRFVLMIVIFGVWYFYTNDKSGIFSLEKINLKSVLLLLVSGIIIQLGTDAVLSILTAFFKSFMSSYNNMIKDYTANFSILFIFTVVILGPIAEELLFRGLIKSYIKKSVNKPEGIIVINIIQALLFGLYHGNIIQGVYAFIFGLLLGGLALKSGNLLIPTLLHIIINGSLFLIPKELYSSLPISFIIMVAAFTVLIPILIFLFRCIRSEE